MTSAGLVQTNGLGLRLCSRMVHTHRRMRLRVMMEKTLSTALIQEAEVGVKWSGRTAPKVCTLAALHAPLEWWRAYWRLNPKPAVMPPNFSRVGSLPITTVAASKLDCEFSQRPTRSHSNRLVQHRGWTRSYTRCRFRQDVELGMSWELGLAQTPPEGRRGYKTARETNSSWMAVAVAVHISACLEPQ